MEKFSYEENGYNRHEVNLFVGEVIKQTEGVIARVKSQEQELYKLRAELEHYRKIEGTLKQAIFNAEEASNNIKRMARDEANMIMRDARHNANRIVNEALLRSEKIQMESDTLLRNTKIFKNRLKAVVEQQLTVVEEIEKLELE